MSCSGDETASRKVKVLVPTASADAILHGPGGCLIWEFAERADLRRAWEFEQSFLDAYFSEDACAGVPLFLYSAIATRGAARLQAEADQSDDMSASMLGAHGYCTQEAVNMLVTGAATSNVFDGEKWLGGESPGSDRLRLGGILAQSEVGLLSLFEAYGSLQVGDYLKKPKWPVWLVHAESHYSVAFMNPPTQDDKGGQCSGDEGEEFDVWYYDPLGRQDDEKRITVRPGKLQEAWEEDDLDNNGMIAKVLRTRWGTLADLDWNGAEPIF